MRPLALLGIVLVASACSSRDHGSRLLTSPKQTGEAPAGPLAGGPPTLTTSGRTATGKNLLVLRARGVRLAVRNPHGGTLTVTPRRPPGRTVAATGDHVSFTGTRVGRVVVARTVAVVHTR